MLAQRLRRQHVPSGQWDTPAQPHHLWWDPAAGTDRPWSRRQRALGCQDQRHWLHTGPWLVARPLQAPNPAPPAPLPAATHGSPLVADPTLGVFTQSTFIPQLHLYRAQEMLLGGSACTRLWYPQADAQESAGQHCSTELLPLGAAGLGKLTKIQEN